MKNKIAFVCPDAFSIWIFRQGLAKMLIERGYIVYAIAGRDKYIKKLESIGIRYIPVDFERFMSLKGDLKLIWQLWRIIVREQFCIVHNFTIKPNIYCTFVSRLAGIKNIYNSVTGLGYLYKDDGETGLKISTVKKGISLLYACASRVAARTWFQNQDDVAYFCNLNLIKIEKAILIKSSGIDTTHWNINNFTEEQLLDIRTEIGVDRNSFIVIMVSRALKSKGIDEFLFAAKLLQLPYPDIKFLLIGGTEETGSVGKTADTLRKKELTEDSNFIWLGHRHDVLRLIATSDVCVLPSYYREGVPRNLLEGMAMSKPIVTTDSVGCRETVDHGENGFLIPPKDVKALANALTALYSDTELRLEMGRASRNKVIKEFEEQIIVDQLLNKLYQF